MTKHIANTDSMHQPHIYDQYTTNLTIYDQTYSQYGVIYSTIASRALGGGL